MQTQTGAILTLTPWVNAWQELATDYVYYDVEAILRVQTDKSWMHPIILFVVMA